MDISANLGSAPVTVLLHAGRIWCSNSCQNIHAATQNLVSQTLELGLTPSPLPAKFGVTYTMGDSDPGHPFMPRVSSAAAALLHNFRKE